MILLRALFFRLLDSCCCWVLPKWRRSGRETLAALCLYINNNKPDIPAEELQHCCAQRDALARALAGWNPEETKRLTQQIALHGESLPGFRRGALAELVESFFVIMVVFLGIRTYYAQPFRIPTGSMQPTLNGIIVHPVDNIPALPVRLWDMLTLGSSYIEATADSDKQLVDISDRPKWLLFTETTLRFSDNSTVTVPSAKGAVIQYLKERGKITESLTGLRLHGFRAGEPIIRARVDAGDLVIVNRLSYNFRHPRRGETFVFDTRGINTSGRRSTLVSMQDQQSGTHYIKRLCGLPGDILSIQSPALLVNGAPAREPGIARVIAGQPPYNAGGYQSLSHLLQPGAWLSDRGPSLLRDTPQPTLREYAALGDNTRNSLDSRYWGPVRQFNIIGPAALTLWPFTSHWGLID